MLDGIKSKYILKEVLDFIQPETYLKIFNYNKKMQDKSDISLEDYKKYSNRIVIEVIPIYVLSPDCKFVNMIGDESLYHIYFNEDVKEQKRNIIDTVEIITSIKIIIDKNEKMKSLSRLFKSCNEIKKINF